MNKLQIPVFCALSVHGEVGSYLREKYTLGLQFSVWLGALSVLLGEMLQEIPEERLKDLKEEERDWRGKKMTENECPCGEGLKATTKITKIKANVAAAVLQALPPETRGSCLYQAFQI